jgi:Mg2+/Co2+ transporter CorC
MEDLYDEYRSYETTMIEYSAENYKDYTTANISSIDDFKTAFNTAMEE